MQSKFRFYDSDHSIMFYSERFISLSKFFESFEILKNYCQTAELMPCLEITDRTGKDAYLYDISLFAGRHEVLIWNQSECRFKTKMLHSDIEFGFENAWSLNAAIIGNLSQNPELVKN